MGRTLKNTAIGGLIFKPQDDGSVIVEHRGKTVMTYDTDGSVDMELNSDLTGNQTISGTLAVTGATTLTGALDASAGGLTGATDVDGALTATSLVTDAGVTATTTVRGTTGLSGDESTSVLRTTKTTLTNANIKALAATQIELVAAEAGKSHQLVSIAMQLNYGSEALTESADNLAVKYVDDSGLAAIATLEMTGFIDQTNDVYLFQKADDIAAGTTAQVVNTALVLDNTGSGEFGGNASNDTTMEVWVTYWTHTVS